MADAPGPRLLEWRSEPIIVRRSPGELVVAGVLADGERPVANDELVQLARGGDVWRVTEIATRFQPPSGPLTVTVYLAEPDSNSAVSRR